MIELGYIMPDGQEVDLSNYSNSWGSVHVQYAVDYISKVRNNNPAIYEKYRKFAWNYRGFRMAPQVEFVVAILGWLKVGNYSMPSKKISYSYLSSYEEFSREGRMAIIESYEKNGYITIPAHCCYHLDRMEEPPKDYNP